MNKKISAEIVADSINTFGDRITTYLLTYPRFIHAELMTHRMFSRGSASSRAIPFKRMLQMVEEDPFIPIAWQKDHPGMQGIEYFTDENMYTWDSDNQKNKSGISFVRTFKFDWLNACSYAIEHAKILHNGRRQSKGHQYYENSELTKQLCNRLLEPFMWHTVLVTATEYDNFFELRCPKYFETELEPEFFKSKKDLLKKYPFRINEPKEYWYKVNRSQAEIHIQALAESMWDAMNESTPKKLQAGEWHIPLFNNHTVEELDLDILPKNLTVNEFLLKISTARCARLSYLNHDGEIDYEKDIQLHDKLLLDKHMSPFEHCARAMVSDEYFNFHKGDYRHKYTDEEQYKKSFGWCNNFKGFMQYRYLIENNLI